jgi:hypothetical protein
MSKSLDWLPKSRFAILAMAGTWIAVQIENDGKKGGWGSLVSALIP